MSLTQRQYVESMLLKARELLAMLPEAERVNRRTMTSHIAELERELATLPDARFALAKAEVYFDGGPVIGSAGIEATAGGKFIDALGRAVRWQANKRGAKNSSFCVTAPVYGSFGFAFEEIAADAYGQQDLGLDRSLVAVALEDIIALMEAAADDKERFGELLEGIASYSVSAVRDLFRSLHDTGTNMRINSYDRVAAFDRMRVESAHTVTSSTIIKQRTERVPGYFGGLLPNSRQFEHNARTAGQSRVISGDLALDVDADVVKRWLDKPCIATLKVTVTRPPGRPPRTQHTLLSIEGVPTEGTEPTPRRGGGWRNG